MTNLSRPETILETAWSEALRRWSRPGAIDAVRDAVTTIEAAQNRLSKRTDARANAARKHLAKAYTRLAEPLKVIEEIGPQLDQPRAIALLQRIAAARDAAAHAQETFEMADPSEIRAARDALDRVGAEARKLDREIAAIGKALTHPVADTSALKIAADQTAQLMQAAGVTSQPMRAMHLALSQAASADATVAKLWVCFETGPGTKAAALFDARHQMYVESHDPVAEPASAAE